MPLFATTKAVDYRPPPGSSRATLEPHLKPRLSRRCQVAVGARQARLISRGRWKGAEGGGERTVDQWTGLIVSYDHRGAGPRCTYRTAGEGLSLRAKSGRRGRRARLGALRS